MNELTHDQLVEIAHKALWEKQRKDFGEIKVEALFCTEHYVYAFNGESKRIYTFS